MVKKALQKYGDRVEIVTAPGNGEEKFRALLEDRNIERLVQFIDSDSYQAVKSLPINQNPKLLVDDIYSEASGRFSSGARSQNFAV